MSNLYKVTASKNYEKYTKDELVASGDREMIICYLRNGISAYSFGKIRNDGSVQYFWFPSINPKNEVYVVEDED